MRVMSVLGLFSFAVLTACAGEPAIASAPASRAQSLGILQIERAQAQASDGAVSSASTAPSVIGAAFARYQGMTGGDVVQMLGAAGAAPLEGCVMASPSATPQMAEVELLDVGVLDVDEAAGDAHVRLFARTFPELGGIASGLFYAGNASFSPSAGAVYTFRASGGEQIAPFEVAIAEPGDVEGLRVNGVPSTEALFVAHARGVELGWDAGDARDAVEMELQDGARTLACSAADDGAFLVPPSAIRALRAGPGRLVLRRVHTEPVDVEGVDTAYARVVATRWFPIELQ